MPAHSVRTVRVEHKVTLKPQELREMIRLQFHVTVPHNARIYSYNEERNGDITENDTLVEFIWEETETK